MISIWSFISGVTVAEASFGRRACSFRRSLLHQAEIGHRIKIGRTAAADIPEIESHGAPVRARNGSDALGHEFGDAPIKRGLVLAIRKVAIDATGQLRLRLGAGDRVHQRTHEALDGGTPTF